MSTASCSSLIVLDVVAEEPDTATSRYLAEGSAAAAAFSWPAAERTMSTLSGTRALRSLCEDHGIPKGYRPYFAHDKAACCDDCPGDTIAVYADALDAGMRFPLHDFHVALLRHYGLAPGQLAPNAWRYVVSFVLLCKDAGVEPMLSVFQHFFSICTHKGDASGWHHFKPSIASTRRLFTGKMSRTMYAGWKTRFFFLQAPPNAPWPCLVKWGKPSRNAVRKPQVTTATKTAIDKLLDRVGSMGTDVGKFLSRRLPVGRIISLTPELTAVKREPGIEQQTRKRKSPEQHFTPCSDAAEMSTPPLGSAARSGPASCGDRSATRKLSQMAQMVEAELHGKERELHVKELELQARAGEVTQLRKELWAARDSRAEDVARLDEELWAARDTRAADVVRLDEELRAARDAYAADVDRHREELQKIEAIHAAELNQLREERQKIDAVHAAEVIQLREELQRANAEASRLAEELQKVGSEHAAEVQAVRVQHQRELISLEHRSVVAMNERYIMGLMHMRSLAHARYPGVVDPSELKHKLLPDVDDDDDLGFPPQPPPGGSVTTPCAWISSFCDQGADMFCRREHLDCLRLNSHKSQCRLCSHAVF